MKQSSKTSGHSADLAAHKALPQPYQRLFSDGRPDAYGPLFWKGILEDLEGRPRSEVVDALTRMSLDRSYITYSRRKENDPRGDTPARALHALTELGHDAFPAVKRVLPLLWTFDDTLTDAVVAFYRSQGPAMLPIIEEWLNSRWTDDNNPAAFLTEVLGVLPSDYPDCRDEVTDLLKRTVDNTENSKETVAWSIFCLLELEDRSAIDTILAASMADRVDTEIITLQDTLDEFNIEIVPDTAPGLIQVMSAVPRQGRVQPEFAQPEHTETDHIRDPATNVPFVHSEQVGRNHPCPCGSGKKYKKCCGFSV